MTELPQTRTRTVHWAATAVALAAVVGGAALIQPPDATARTVTARTAASPPPDPERAVYPVNCGQGSHTSADTAAGNGPRVRVTSHGAADFDGDGRSETVAVVRCDSGTGSPPDGVFVLAAPDGGQSRPQVTETLVPASEQMNVRDFSVRGGTVSATLLGYSSPEVPRCCPDQQRKVKWVWKQGKFKLLPAAMAGGAMNV